MTMAVDALKKRKEKKLHKETKKITKENNKSTH